MTENEFRKLALAFPGAVESAHMNHPDFRLGGKIFATLGAPADGWGMVKLTPAAQRTFVGKAPEVFRPCNGAWGLQGCTYVHLAPATKALVEAALVAARENVVAHAVKKKRVRPKT
jgi:hypothetical protein